MHVPRVDQTTLGQTVGGHDLCHACQGFCYQTPRAGLWIVCTGGCNGSGLQGIDGKREPGEVVRDFREEQVASKGDRIGEPRRRTEHLRRP